MRKSCLVSELGDCFIRLTVLLDRIWGRGGLECSESFQSAGQYKV